jgi:hypothetical protein
MNLHHGILEELLYLAWQLRGLIATNGLLFSHDVYRPDAQPYRRRPNANPDDPAESFRLTDASRVAAADIPKLDLTEETDPGEPLWRRD